MQSAWLGTWPHIAGMAVPSFVTVHVIVWFVAVCEPEHQLEAPRARNELAGLYNIISFSSFPVS